MKKQKVYCKDCMHFQKAVHDKDGVLFREKCKAQVFNVFNNEPETYFKPQNGKNTIEYGFPCNINEKNNCKLFQIKSFFTFLRR